MATSPNDRYHPWPVRQLRDRLCSDDTLWKLCRPKATATKHDIREADLEALAAAVMKEQFGSERVRLRRPIAETLGIHSASFPARALPDIVVNMDGSFHVCELKSSRTDYNRFDDVFESRPFKDYLESLGHYGSAPWEVEQDLIKLRLYYELSDRVRSCLFIMIDAYDGPGPAWANVFADPLTFTSTMRTQLVRGWVTELLAGTTIEPISAGRARAKMIVCEVPLSVRLKQASGA